MESSFFFDGITFTSNFINYFFYFVLEDFTMGISHDVIS